MEDKDDGLLELIYRAIAVWLLAGEPWVTRESLIAAGLQMNEAQH